MMMNAIRKEERKQTKKKIRKSSLKGQTRLLARLTNEKKRCVSCRGLVRGKAVIHNRR
jgi:hypothetical protein